MNIETSITIKGAKYVFDETKIDNVVEVCEACALHELCADIDGTTLCDNLGLARHSTSNFRRAKPEETDTPDTANSRLLNEDTYKALRRLGILDTSVRSYNRGSSDYSRHIIQPWAIWQEYNLNPWDADIVKRILRTKEGDPRRLDYEKIIHICEERIRQIENETL